MKKTLIAVAAAALSMGAMAQNVTLSGTISASYQNDQTTSYGAASSGNTNTNVQQLDGGAADATARTGVRPGKGLAMTDASVRFAATEDLGGGLKASADFTWETSAAFRGGAVTRADGGIGVSSGFGTIAYRNTRSSDLIAAIASPAINLPDGVYDTGIVARGGIDTLSYALPEFVKGLSLGVSYVEGNDGPISVPNAGAKSVYVLSGAYAMGPLRVAAQMKSHSLNDSDTTTQKNQAEMSATYDAGIVRVAVAHDAKTTRTGKSALGFSATVPMGALSFGVQQFKRDTLKQTDFGATYALSPRTSLSASTGKVSSNVAAQNRAGNQYRIRLGHTF